MEWKYVTKYKGETKTIISNDLKDFEMNVCFNGFNWDIVAYVLNDSFKPDSGYLNVLRVDNVWVYNSDRVIISAKHLDELESLVLDENLEWKITDEYLADKSFDFDEDLKNKEIIQKRESKFRQIDDKKKQKRQKENELRQAIFNEKKTTESGYFGVSKVNENGGYWRYDYKDETIYANTIKKLEIKVKTEKLPWVIVDYDLAKLSLRDNREAVEKEKLKNFDEKVKSMELMDEIKKEESLKLKKQKELDDLLSPSGNDYIKKIKKY